MGTITYTCTTCGVTKVEHINSTHSYSDWKWKVSSYIRMSFNGITDQHIPTETHLKFRVCDTCGHKEYAELPNHPCYEQALNIGSFTHSATREATCSVPELTRYTCNVCGWYFEYESSTSEHTWEGRKSYHLSDYTEYTDELDVEINTCAVCGSKVYSYIWGESSQFFNNYDISPWDIYFSHRKDAEDYTLLEHPDRQTIFRNVVRDSDGHITEFDISWWDTDLHKRCTDTVIVADVPVMFEKQGFDMSKFNLNRELRFHFVFFYGQLIPSSIGW